MSNIEKNYIDIPDLSCFDKNRVHEVKELNVNNSYLGIGIKNGSSYVYAIKSSPNYYSLQPQHKSDAYIYVRHNDNNSNQSYSFYRGYSYTYTEGLSANNQKTALIAYQFVNRTADNSITLYNIDTKLTHTALNGGTETAPCHVNEKSDTSYFLRKQNESNNIEIDNTSVKLGNIKSNLGNDTYTKFNTYCKYSALNPSDYIIHDDCEFDMNMGAYVWNLVDGYDTKAHAYTGLSDTNMLTAYAYIDCEDSLHSFFRSQSQIFDYDATHYKYIDFNYDNINVSGQQWKLGTNGTSSSYVYDNNISYAQFYANAKHNLSGHETDSFEEIVNHPSYRNNYGIVESYINIKGLSQPSGTESMNISQNSQNNYNTAKFIKRINDLPVHIVSDTIYFNITLNLGFITGYDIQNGNYASNDNPQGGSIQNFKLRLIESEQDNYGYKDYNIPLIIELEPFIRLNKGPSMKVVSIIPPQSNDHSEYEINNWQQSPSSINGDTEQFVFTFDLKILDSELYNIFSYYENNLNSLLSILELQFEATGSCIGSDHAAINVSLGGKNCSTNKTNADYEWNIFRITRNSSNGYLSSINIEITYGEFNH